MSECAFCDGAASIEAYQKESTADEIYALLALFKICVGFKVSVEFKKSFKHVDVVFTPFLRGWKVQSSKDDDGFYEPRNSSLEVGGGVGVRF